MDERRRPTVYERRDEGLVCGECGYRIHKTAYRAMKTWNYCPACGAEIRAFEWPAQEAHLYYKQEAVG